MNKPQLIAETPRAGKWNHRFIAAKHGKLSDGDITKKLAAARINPQGDDYISVSVETAQSLSGRTGTEILVLTGIDVKKLSESERKEIVEQLEQRLNNDLDKLITKTIDWDKDGEAILLKRPELAEWEKAFSKLPIFIPPIETKPKKLHIGLVGIGFVLVLGLVVWQMDFSSDSKPITDTTVNGNQKDSEKSSTPEHEPPPKTCMEIVFNNDIKGKILTLFDDDRFKPDSLSCDEPKQTITDFKEFLNESCGITIENYDNNIGFNNDDYKANKDKIDPLKQEFENCYNPTQEQNAK